MRCLQLLPVVNFWSDGFQYPIGSAMKSAYCTVQVSYVTSSSDSLSF